METWIKNGYYTINETRAKEGLREVPGGDVGNLPKGTIPLDSPMRGADPLASSDED